MSKIRPVVAEIFHISRYAVGVVQAMLPCCAGYATLLCRLCYVFQVVKLCRLCYPVMQAMLQYSLIKPLCVAHLGSWDLQEFQLGWNFKMGRVWQYGVKYSAFLYVFAVGAIKYLKGKQGLKGQEIKYSCNEISEYLLTINNNLTIYEKRRLFGVRSKMIDIPSNFSRVEKDMNCQCGQK